MNYYFINYFYLYSHFRFGQVFLGKYRGETVAVKQLNITQGEASSFQTESVENEIKLMTQLRSQFIVSFYGAMVCQLFLFLFLILFPQRSPDSIYIVIEYCQKGSLTNHLGSNKLRPELKRLIALDCAKGMLV